MRTPGWAAAAALVLAVTAGTWLRIAPSTHPPGTQFLTDGATIARLALASSVRLRMPAVDSLAEAPAGRRLGPALAPGLIVGAGAFHRALAALGSRDANFNLSLFGALCGGLIAVPVFLWARVQWGPGWAAPFAALLIAFLPAHLHRTFGYFMRYEAAGSLLVTSHFACAAAALASKGSRKRWAWALAAALLMLVSLWTWRVPLIVPLIESILLGTWILARGAEPVMRDTFAIEMFVVTAGMFGVEYLRAQRVPLSTAWLASVAIAAAACVPRLAPGRARMAERAAWLALGVALAVVVSRFTGGESSYGSMATFLPAKLRLLLHQPVAPGPVTRLMLAIEELGSISPAAFFAGAMNLAFIGPWLLASPLVFWLAAGRPRPGRLAIEAPSLFLAGLVLSFTLLALFVYRAKVLVAPIAAVTVAGILPALLAGRGPAVARAPGHGARAKRSGPGRSARSHPPRLRLALAALLLASLAANAWIAVVIASTRESRLPADEQRALRYLRDETPANSTITTLWEYGFEVQSYANRRTLVDGFLEDADFMPRAIGMARAALGRSPESLAAWSRAHGSRYLLVPPSTQLLGVATLAAPSLVPKLQDGAHLSPLEADRTLIRMMVYGRDEPPFTRVFESGLWRVYALADSPAVTTSR